MSNTPPIAQYFLEERHWAELNRDNPLGNHGEIAKAFADLLHTMWSGNHHSFPPRAFKVILQFYLFHYWGIIANKDYIT